MKRKNPLYGKNVLLVFLKSEQSIKIFKFLIEEAVFGQFKK